MILDQYLSNDDYINVYLYNDRMGRWKRITDWNRGYHIRNETKKKIKEIGVG